MMDDLRRRLRKLVEPTKAEMGWYEDPDAVADERVDAILAEIGTTHRLVENGRAERLIQWAQYAHWGDLRSWFRKGQRPTVSLEPGDLDPFEEEAQ